MSLQIGPVELAIVSDIDNSKGADIDEIKDGFKSIDVVPVQHESSLDTITISGFVNKEAHSTGLEMETQKKELKRLRKRKAEKNPINYGDFYGHLLVEDVDFNDNSDSKIVNEVEITARYFPWPKYFGDNEI